MELVGKGTGKVDCNVHVQRKRIGHGGSTWAGNEKRKRPSHGKRNWSADGKRKKAS